MIEMLLPGLLRAEGSHVNSLKMLLIFIWNIIIGLYNCDEGLKSFIFAIYTENGGSSMSLLTKLQAAQDVLSTLVRPTHSGITSGELMFDPANWHGHQGNNDIFVLTKQGVDFQLFRSHDDVTFIYGKDDAASYWGGGNQQIYDLGSGTTLRFSELENQKVNVYGMEHDPTAKVVFYNAADPT